MESVDQLVFVMWSEVADHGKRMTVGHSGQAEALMNLPCREQSLLSHFYKAPSNMLDEIRGLNDYETQSDKLVRKLRESPFFGIGLLAMTAVSATGAYRFRRGAVTLPTPHYLMQLRVTAQSACVGSLVAGAAYTMATQHINNSDA